jgi:hypothetical protein
MELESVRALKAELSENLIQPLIEETRGLATFAVSARSLDRMTGIRPGIALGITRAGPGHYLLAVRIQQRPLESSETLRTHFLAAAKGEVDYQYVGRVSKRQGGWTQQRQRPLLIGCSIGHFNITAGTLGAFVRRRGSDGVAILSNNHVLADEDRGQPGDAILQPGKYDNGHDPADRVGALLTAIPLVTAGNLVDAAIASVAEGIGQDADLITGLGPITSVRAAPLETGDEVAKLGRTTGLTHGRVRAFEVDNVVVRYDRGDLSFDRQIEIEGAGANSFSEGGDSGSLIVDGERRACGLLFAGGDQGGANGKGLTYANHIDEVLKALDIDLAI